VTIGGGRKNVTAFTGHLKLKGADRLGCRHGWGKNGWPPLLRVLLLCQQHAQAQRVSVQTPARACMHTQ